MDTHAQIHTEGQTFAVAALVVVMATWRGVLISFDGHFSVLKAQVYTTEVTAELKACFVHKSIRSVEWWAPILLNTPIPNNYSTQEMVDHIQDYII